jgi:hypothetical protein
VIKILTESCPLKQSLMFKFKRLTEVWFVEDCVAEFDLLDHLIALLYFILYDLLGQTGFSDAFIRVGRVSRDATFAL